MTNHTPTTDTPIRELTDAELDCVNGGFGFGFGLLTAQTNGASPTTAVNILPPVGTEFGPGYGQQTAVSTGNFPAFGPPHA
jgi:hypothetical protein